MHYFKILFTDVADNDIENMHLIKCYFHMQKGARRKFNAKLC